MRNYLIFILTSVLGEDSCDFGTPQGAGSAALIQRLVATSNISNTSNTSQEKRQTTHSWDDGLPMQSRVSVPPWSSPRAVEHLSFKQIGFLLGSLFVCVILSHFSHTEMISSIGSWIAASICTNLLNKEAASSFSAMCLLVIIQMWIANIVVIVVRFDDLQLPSLRDFFRWLPVSFLISGMLGTSIFALEGTTVSTVNIIRNVLPIVTFVLEKLLFNSPRLVKPGHVLSMVLTLFGTTLYGLSNFSVTSWSLIMILLGTVLTVVDKLLQRHLLMSPDFKQPLAMCMIMNNTFGMLPLFLVAILTRETKAWPYVLDTSPWSTWILLVGSGLSGCCLGFYGLAVSRLITAASVLMLQNMSKVLVILLSVLMLGDDLSGLSAVGCAMSMAGSAWYGYVTLVSGQEASELSSDNADPALVSNSDSPQRKERCSKCT